MVPAVCDGLADVGDSVVATFDCEAEPSEQTRVDLDTVLEVRQAECDVPSLILEREVRDLTGHHVRGARLDERQEIEERALTQHRQQEGRQREIGLVEERLQRRPTSRRRYAERATA